ARPRLRRRPAALPAQARLARRARARPAEEGRAPRGVERDNAVATVQITEAGVHRSRHIAKSRAGASRATRPGVDGWRRYWFADGGRYCAAIVRIGIAVSVLLSLLRLATWSTVEIPGPATLYRPVGIWMIFGRAVPPDTVIDFLWIAA